MAQPLPFQGRGKGKAGGRGGRKGEGEGDGEGGKGRATVFIKSLNFNTTEGDLHRHLASLLGGRGVRSCTIAMGASGSRGFGFAECLDHATALRLVKAGPTSLDGHALHLALAGKREDGEGEEGEGKGGKGGKGGRSRRVVIRNVPFEATRRDLMQILTPFGTLKAMRLPKKFDGSHRGFCFAEFATPKDAAHVMREMGGVHLLGRRLVVEFTSDEDPNAPHKEDSQGGREGGRGEDAEALLKPKKKKKRVA